MEKDSSTPTEQLHIASAKEGARVNRKVLALSLMYGRDCHQSFESLRKSVQVINATKRELVSRMPPRAVAAAAAAAAAAPSASLGDITQPQTCYGCANAFVGQMMGLLEEMARSSSKSRDALVSHGLLEEIVENNVRRGPSASRAAARKVACELTRGSPRATATLCAMIESRVAQAVSRRAEFADVGDFAGEDLELLADACRIPSAESDEPVAVWETRARLAVDLLFRAAAVDDAPQSLFDRIVAPCLAIVASMIGAGSSAEQEKPPAAAAAAAAAPPASKEDEPKMRRKVLRKFEGTDSSSGGEDEEEDEKPKKPRVPAEPPKEEPKQQQQKAAEQGATPAGPATPVIAPQVTGIARACIEALAGPLPQPPLPAEMTKAQVRARFLEEKFFARWKAWVSAKKKKQEVPPPPPPPPLERIFEEKWLWRLLLCRSSEQVRDGTAKILLTLVSLYPRRALELFGLCRSVLPRASQLGEATAQFFRVITKLFEPEDHRVFAAAGGFLPQLCRAVVTEARRIEARGEGAFTAEVTQGFAVRVLVSMLSASLQVPTLRTLFKKSGLIESVIEAFLVLRGLVVSKGKLTDDSAQSLLGVMMSFREAAEEDQVIFMRACVSAMSKAGGRDPRAPVYILEQLCNIVSPPKVEVEYLLNLTKPHSQEEFIPGTMDRNPYSTKDVGPLMRDVKNKICTTLNMKGLIDDDNGMELLVDKQIIKLDLAVKKVYEQVWRPAHKQDCGPAPRGGRGGPPMTVVFRLQGFDGEATEPIIDKLAEEVAVERDPEEEFKIAAVMADCGGLEAILTLLRRVGPADIQRDRELVGLAFRLLFFCSKLEVNRARLLQIGGLEVAVSKLLDALRVLAASPAENRQIENIFEAALLLAEPLATRSCSSASSSTGAPTPMEVDGSKPKPPDPRADTLGSLLESVAAVKKNPKISSAVRRMIPLLTNCDPSLCDLVVAHFSKSLVLERGQLSAAASEQWQAFTDIVSNSPGAVKSHIVAAPVVRSLLERLAKVLGEKETEGLECQATQMALGLTNALTKAHAPTQDVLLATGLISVLHALEEVRAAGAEKAGVLAEKILDNVNESERAKAEVEAVRRASREEKQKLAQRKRQEILEKMGLKQQGTKIMLSATPGSVETIEDESGVACMVCHEGYTLRPKDVLGFYTWMRPTALHSFAATRAQQQLPAPARSDSGVTTVTHFNVIHLRCHEEATKGEKKKKQPLEEWEAAALRNHNTRCNNLFPMPGPDVTDDGFVAALERYWSLVSNVRRTDSSRTRLIIHDLKFTLMRFCYDGTPAAPLPQPPQPQPAGGAIVTEGGRESNLRMCAFMINMALFISSPAAPAAARGHKSQQFDADRSLAQFLSSDRDTWVPSSALPDNALFYLALSLPVMTPTQWRLSKPAFLQRLIAYSFFESNACKSATPAASSSSTAAAAAPSASGPMAPAPDKQAIFMACKPSLLMMSLVDRLHAAIKKGLADQPTSDAAWGGALRAHLTRESGPIGDRIAEVLKALDEEVSQFADVMEFMDDLQVLEVIMKEYGSVESFVSGLWQSFSQSS